jgi:hypothetical protein
MKSAEHFLLPRLPANAAIACRYDLVVVDRFPAADGSWSSKTSVQKMFGGPSAESSVIPTALQHRNLQSLS